MADFFVPSNLFQGRGSAESPGTGSALGDTMAAAWSGSGADYNPAEDASLGGINHMSLGVMASESTGDSSKEQPAAFLRAFLEMGANGGQYTINVQGGSPIVIEQCAYAAPSADGFFWCGTSDIGTGPGQIDPNPLLWSADMFRPHPRTFMRSPSHARGVVSQLLLEDANEIAGGFPGVNVWVVQSAPVWSKWVLVIDGAAHTVIFPHPVASDIRRPRDVYSQVVVPALQKAISQGSPMEVWRDAGAGTLVNRGYLSRLNFVQYARFVSFNDINATLLFQPV